MWQGRAVPEVLLSGHHAADRRLAAGARRSAITRERRPDLWARHQRRAVASAPAAP